VGDEEACLGIVLDFQTVPLRWSGQNLDVPELLAGSPVDFLERFPNLRHESLVPGLYLLFAMESEFGSRPFGEFWRSPLPPAEAFEEAFGEPLEAWVMRMLRSYVAPSPVGPGVPLQAAAYTLLTFGFLAGFAVRAGRR
jgi:hypothetical protein